MTKIIRLSSENVKRLSVVEIKPDGSIVVVGGRNGQGKSSVLDSIAIALGGKDEMCDVPVRRGEKKATIVVETDDGLVVKRTITDGGGGSLTVTGDGGKVKYSSPQAMLDSLIGKMAFDPLAFTRKKPREQVDDVRALVGLDFTAMDAERKTIYADRTRVNTDADGVLAKMRANPPPGGKQEEPVAVVMLVAQLADRRKQNERAEQSERTLGNAQRSLDAAQKRLADAERAVSDAKIEVDTATAAFDNAKDGAVARVSTEDLETQIAESEAINARCRARDAYAGLQAQERELRKKSDDMTAAIEKIDESKKTMLASASWPVDGLGFSDAGLTMNGLPFDQASSAEQLRVSVAMGLSLNPKLKVLLIRDGSLLDEQSLAMIAAMASESDAQVWIERVGNGAECSVVIEDGSVRNSD